MALNLPLDDILKDLEARLADHQAQALHHEAERARHQAEIEEISRKLSTFRAALAEAESLGRLPSSDPGGEDASLELGGKVYTARLVARIVESLPAGEPFGISKILEEINRRYQEQLAKPVKPKQVSVVLRWMLRTGRIRSSQKGRPFHEALYVR